MGLDVRVYWTSYLLYFTVVNLVFLATPLLLAAGASGTISAAGMPAFALVVLCSVPPILLFAFLISFLFKTKEQASGLCSHIWGRNARASLCGARWPDIVPSGERRSY